MRPTTALDDNVFDFDYLLHPDTKFEHPQDVISHSGLTLAEKRARELYRSRIDREQRPLDELHGGFPHGFAA